VNQPQISNPPASPLLEAFDDLVENAPLDFMGTGTSDEPEASEWFARVARVRALIQSPPETPPNIDRQRVRNAISGTLVEHGPVHAVFDNLAIALCTYFDEHPNRPDEETDEELHWTPWVLSKTNAALDAITDAVMKLLPQPETTEVKP
jgi:hypothetical protein